MSVAGPPARTGGPPPPLFALGFLAVLLPTLYVKHDHLLSLYRGDLSVVVRWAVLQPSLAQVVLYTTAFFARDVAEVFVLWASFNFIGRLLLRLRPGVVAAAGTLLALAVIGGNILSFRELRTFVSLDTLLISIEWTRRNPEIVKSYLGWRNLVVVPIAALWASAPVLASRWIERRGGAGRLARLISPAALAIVAALCAALSFGVRTAAFGGRLPMWGYWSSTAASLLELRDRSEGEAPLLGLDQLRDQYRAIAYPEGRGSAPGPGLRVDPAAKRPRNVILIALETAALKYYPILDNPDLPTFSRLQRRAITSEHHFTTRTSTTWSAYSILSGTYAADRTPRKEYGASEADGLASIVAAQGYETTFVDACCLDFHDRDKHRIMWSHLGFSTLIDPENLPPIEGGDAFEKNLKKDEQAFDAVRDAVLGARGRGRKALVFLSTTLGHYEWKARPGDRRLSGRQRIYRICREYDRMLGELLAALEGAGLGDDLIVAVTGDHGLRNEAEFDSLREPMLLGRASFNVPFLLYAPTLLAEERRLPYPTSHVDLTPTILDMIGVPSDGYFFHGESLLDPGLGSRVIFLMNTGLNPTDGYYWKGRFFTYNSLSELAEGGRSESAAEPLSGPASENDLANVPGALRDPKSYLERARANFASAARYFAERRRQRAAPAVTP
jgi:hypothetical protein